MSRWTPFDWAWWDDVVEAIPKPWPEAFASFDLRLAEARGEDHGRPYWMSRWGWKRRAVENLTASTSWRDPSERGQRSDSEVAAGGRTNAEHSYVVVGPRAARGQRVSLHKDNGSTGAEQPTDPNPIAELVRLQQEANPNSLDGFRDGHSRTVHLLEHHVRDGWTIPQLRALWTEALSTFTRGSPPTWAMIFREAWRPMRERVREAVAFEEAPTVVDVEARWAAHEALLAEAKAKMDARAERAAARKAAK